MDTGGSSDQSSISHSGQEIGCPYWPSLCHTLTLIQWEATASEICGVRVGLEWVLRGTSEEDHYSVIRKCWVVKTTDAHNSSQTASGSLAPDFKKGAVSTSSPCLVIKNL